MLPLIFTVMMFSAATLFGDGLIWNEQTSSFGVTITLANEQIEVGDTLEVALTVTLPQGYRLETKKLRDALMSDNTFGPPPFSVIEEREQTSNSKTTVSYLLDSHLSGEYALSFHTVTLLSERAPPLTLITPAFPILVEENRGNIPTVNENIYSSLPLTIDLPAALSPHHRQHYLTGDLALAAEAQRNREIQRKHTFPFLSFATALVVLLFLWAIRLLWRWLRSKESHRRLRQLLRERAYGQLQQFEQQPITDQGDYDSSYTELTAMVRQLVEEIWHLDAPTLTTAEFLHQASHHPEIAPSLQATLQQLLEGADRVKFAHLQPPQQQWKEALEATKTVLDTLFSSIRRQ